MKIAFCCLFLCVFGENTSDTSTAIANCGTLLYSGGTSNGPNEVRINGSRFKILCDQELDGGGWTVIQQRVDGRESFWNRTWKEYRDGFGTIGTNSSFYAGNELIYLLSNQYEDNVTLRIELYGDRNPNSSHTNDFYASNYLFKLGPEASDYTLYISLPEKAKKSNGNASTGWYDVTYNNGIKFSTIDHINDPMPKCQLEYHLGGWWSRFCGVLSLNGEYVPLKFGDGYGMFFVVNGQYVVNPVKTRMLLRDKRFN